MSSELLDIFCTSKQGQKLPLNDIMILRKTCEILHKLHEEDFTFVEERRSQVKVMATVK
jgi:hypothetical protein